MQPEGDNSNAQGPQQSPQGLIRGCTAGKWKSFSKEKLTRGIKQLEETGTIKEVEGAKWEKIDKST